MLPEPVQDRATDARGAVRASLYLAAALYCDGSSSPVKIRNISSTGALVESSTTVPLVGSLVQLVRGGLIVHGLVAWSQDNRCGLKFSGSVDVQRWRAAPCNAEQQRVDEIVRLVKAGAVPLPVPPLTDEASSARSNEPTPELSDHLQKASELLTELGNALAGDEAVLERHGSALQNLDIAMQLIAAVEALITGREIDSNKLSGLRRSADQAFKQHS